MAKKEKQLSKGSSSGSSTTDSDGREESSPSIERSSPITGDELLKKSLEYKWCSRDYPFNAADEIRDERPWPKIHSIRLLLAAALGSCVGTFLICWPLIIFGMVAYGVNYYLLLLVIVIGARDEMTKRAFGWVKDVHPGLYFSDTPENRKIFELWPEHRRTYKSPKWLWSGDISTLIPFLVGSLKLNKILGERAEAGSKYVRTWLKVQASPEDGDQRKEAVALDWFLPHNDTPKRLVLCLHGLNGGSDEAYVSKFITDAMREGNAVVTMIARGMRTPLITPHHFNGARVSDVCATFNLLGTLPIEVSCVGFSMGAVILGNVAVNHGDLIPSNVKSAICVSGMLDVAKVCLPGQISRGHLLWHPFLVLGLQENLAKVRKIVEKRLGVDQVPFAHTVTDFDRMLTAPALGYGSGQAGIMGYYSHMSGCPMSEPNSENKLKNVKIKLLHLHSVDDPISPADNFAPQLKVSTDNCWFVMTNSGGHVGYTEGNPWTEPWNWQSQFCLSFIDAVHTVKSKNKEKKNTKGVTK